MAGFASIMLSSFTLANGNAGTASIKLSKLRSEDADFVSLYRLIYFIDELLEFQ